MVRITEGAKGPATQSIVDDVAIPQALPSPVCLWQRDETMRASDRRSYATRMYATREAVVQTVRPRTGRHLARLSLAARDCLTRTGILGTDTFATNYTTVCPLLERWIMNASKRTSTVMACALTAAVVSWMASGVPAYAQGMGSSKLAFDPSSLSVAPGASASAKVMVTLASGATWGTTLAAADAPKRLSVSFDPAEGDPTFASTMTVHADTSLTPGTYTVKISATGDDPAAAETFKVTVGKGP